MSSFQTEVKNGQRFEFGKNWRSFLSTLTDEKIKIAETSLKEMLDIEDLTGKRFLDAGSGSGLFSLVARRLGAKVHSFDYDPASVACTRELRLRYFPDDPDWIVEEGSVLDSGYLESLGLFDIVYSWGVLHHTGDMWTAFEGVAGRVKDNGNLFIAIYNDQARKSLLWKKVKEFYCSGFFGKAVITCVFIPHFFFRAVLACILKGENVFAEYKKSRGMSIVHDWYDWLGGLPFEVAKVEEIFHFFKERGFVLANIETTNGLGNNQFVLCKKRS